MSFWSGETLRKELSNIVAGSDPSLIDCAAYTLRIGSEIYITPHKDGIDPQSTTKRYLNPSEAFCIPPGQFAFLHTQEKVTLRDDLLGFISIKATTKFKGLINVSGFHVDPGYNGCLIFSVFNAGPSPIHLQQGAPLFLLWVSTLDDDAKKEDAKNENRTNEIPLGNNGIPVKLINNIPGRILSLHSLQSELRKLEQKVFELRTITFFAYGALLLVLAIILRDPISEFFSESRTATHKTQTITETPSNKAGSTNSSGISDKLNITPKPIPGEPKPSDQ